MVVEDDSRLRRAFAWALEREFDVVSAGTVEEAVSVLEKDREVALVLCDLMLDGQTGVELFDKLEASRGRPPRTPIAAPRAPRCPASRRSSRRAPEFRAARAGSRSGTPHR
jgi:CheY-like chemotaxis protein